jgi:5-methylthioadenosine/S-adenosylhomocysteine deaminase
MPECDLLLTNAAVLTMDKRLTAYEPGAVAITGDQLVAIGPQAELCQAYLARETCDCQGKVLLPGLINAHTHAAMTLLRGLADDLRLDVWLLGYIMPVEREFVSPEFVRLGTALACAEMIRSGVTCFADMYYFEEHVAQAVAEAGMRALCGQTVLKFPTPDAQSFEESLAAAREFIQRWKGHPLIEPSIAPHAPYTCTEEILRSAAALAVEYDVPLQIHLAETLPEAERSRAEHGHSVVQYVKEHRLFEAKVLAAHCVHVDTGDMLNLLHAHAGVAHNPSSNLKLASGAAPVQQMLDLGLSVGIGTDGAASNNDLDLFEELRLAAMLAKNVSGDPMAMPAATALTMATRLGAKALHLEHLIGSLEPGKRADLILVDTQTLHNSPRFRRDHHSVYAQLVYAAHAHDVTDVMVNGRWLMRARQLTTLDEGSLLAQAEVYARRIDAFLIPREQSVLSKLIAIGGAAEVESFEVQAKIAIVDVEPVYAALERPQIEILYSRHYREYDTYFLFSDATQGRVRYREDETIDAAGQISSVRYRLTLIGPAREGRFESDVLLSRSRYLAPAVHSLRFYREYFKPEREIYIAKDRLRWRVLFQGTEFYINLDCLNEPALGRFLEVKSRTWSRRDAEHKALIARELVQFLGASPAETIPRDYAEIVSAK